MIKILQNWEKEPVLNENRLGIWKGNFVCGCNHNNSVCVTCVQKDI